MSEVTETKNVNEAAGQSITADAQAVETVEAPKPPRATRPAPRFSEADTLYSVLNQQGEPMYYRDLIEAALGKLGYQSPYAATDINFVYSQLNLDMRFVHFGNGMWGIRNWAPTKTAKKVPTISLLSKTVDYDDSDVDDEFDERDHDYGRSRDDDWERAD
ncbi:DNA-directed RNA polymerase subunit delta [Heliophilum fasciatum]|uniref:RNAP delta factor n=1 Tax=Heliophilum fasciatum TaxID=35700 RepID=A0A4R2RMI3_9FIRM|nr:DNA-directed RNA polymerase subunit delta [Heliophilum fasciatum]MCW2277507.1 DNA-directed RNA polymerase subunit delta [Heliophilum fasciatum]TCP65202.1 DNA-directed RNA polymerase subunit delta [Heliophilum fasciatum]